MQDTIELLDKYQKNIETLKREKREDFMKFQL